MKFKTIIELENYVTAEAEKRVAKIIGDVS